MARLGQELLYRVLVKTSKDDAKAGVLKLVVGSGSGAGEAAALAEALLVELVLLVFSLSLLVLLLVVLRGVSPWLLSH